MSFSITSEWPGERDDSAERAANAAQVEIAALKAELAARRAKAAAFDWLADGIAKKEIDIFINHDDGINEVTVSVLRPGYKGWYEYTAPTLAEAVRLAMDAEGER